jgi:ribosomal protein L31E
MRKHVTKHMETEDTKLEKKMDDFVEKSIQEMPVRKREKLESELDSGANISYERI